ncbi:hypothetical protein PHJA_000392700 [Phtheirospermum japonicum]|uniref:dolichol kinase n=1 Tax=Phtheirospermum japonicum TaxID=374723 RepID=A0A830B5Z5_9LAMI|nr:hypothetical protein PHJA_000392700 [Phtheirospermum japonicum]
MALSLSLSEQLNGERAVVLLYIVRILFSTPLSLLPEAFSLSFLSLFALSVEISADDAFNPLSHPFRTRPGAPSGIFLGAVTLPGLLVSRLIQTLRAESLQEIGIEGWSLALMSLWVLIHGLAAVTLIQKILRMFPACASIGESFLVTTGLVIYFGDMTAYTAANVGFTVFSFHVVYHRIHS